MHKPSLKYEYHMPDTDHFNTHQASGVSQLTSVISMQLHYGPFLTAVCEYHPVIAITNKWSKNLTKGCLTMEDFHGESLS